MRNLSENITQEVDIVLPWVDGNDPRWLDQYIRYKGNIVSFQDNTMNRYRGVDTLKFVIHGIKKFLPWIRYIFLVTASQKPEWLDTNDKKVRIIDHREIFEDRTALPIFNSSAIEFNIHRIKDLSEKFILFNDDTLLLKKTDINRFFINDKPVDFLLQTVPRGGKLYYALLKDRGDWPKMVNNNIQLINKHFNKKLIVHNNLSSYYTRRYPWNVKLCNFVFNLYPKFLAFAHYHQPQPYLKSHLKRCNELYQNEIKKTIGLRFKHKDCITSYLYRYTALVKGEFYPVMHNDHECCRIYDEKSLRNLSRLLKTKRFVCINDTIDLCQKNNAKISLRLVKLLEDTFFEKQLAQHADP